MIFNSSYQPSDWGMEPSVVIEEGDVPHTCPPPKAVSSHEFKPPLPKTELAELANKNFSNETMKQIC